MSNQTTSKIDTIELESLLQVAITTSLDQKIIPIFQDCIEIDTINSTEKSKNPIERRQIIYYINLFISFIDFLKSKNLDIEIVNIEGDGIRALGNKRAINALLHLVNTIKDYNGAAYLRAVALKNPEDGSCRMFTGNNPLLSFPGLQEKMSVAKSWGKTHPNEYKDEYLESSVDAGNLIKEFYDNALLRMREVRVEEVDNKFLCIAINCAGRKGGIESFIEQFKISQDFQDLLRGSYLLSAIDLKISVDSGRILIIITPKSDIDEDKIRNLISEIKKLLIEFSKSHKELDVDFKMTSAQKVTYSRLNNTGEDLIDYSSNGFSTFVKMQPPLERPQTMEPNLWVIGSSLANSPGFKSGLPQSDGRVNLKEAIPLTINNLNDFISHFLPYLSEEYSFDVMSLFARRIQDLIIGGENSLLKFAELAAEIEHYYFFKLNEEILPEENSTEFLIARFSKLSGKYQGNESIWGEICRVLSIIKDLKGNIKVDQALATYLDIELNSLNNILEILDRNNLVFFSNANLVVPGYLATAAIRQINVINPRDAERMITQVVSNLYTTTYEQPILEQVYLLAKNNHNERAASIIAISLIRSQVLNGCAIELSNNTDDDFEKLLDNSDNQKERDLINFYKFCKSLESAIKRRDITIINQSLSSILELILFIDEVEAITLSFRIVESLEAMGSTIDVLKDKIALLKKCIKPKLEKNKTGTGMQEFIEDENVAEKEKMAIACSLNRSNLNAYFPNLDSIISFIDYYTDPFQKDKLKKRYVYLILLKLINQLFVILSKEKESEEVKKRLSEKIQLYFNLLLNDANFPDLLARYSVNLTPFFFKIYVSDLIASGEPPNTSAILEYCSRGLIESLVTQNKRLVLIAYNNFLMMSLNMPDEVRLVKATELFRIVNNLLSPTHSFSSNGENLYVDNYLGMQLNHTLIMLLKKYLDEKTSLDAMVINLAKRFWSCILSSPNYRRDEIISNILELINEFPHLLKDIIFNIPTQLEFEDDKEEIMEFLGILFECIKNVFVNESEQKFTVDKPSLGNFTSRYLEIYNSIKNILKGSNDATFIKFVDFLLRNITKINEDEFRGLVTQLSNTQVTDLFKRLRLELSIAIDDDNEIKKREILQKIITMENLFRRET